MAVRVTLVKYEFIVFTCTHSFAYFYHAMLEKGLRKQGSMGSREGWRSLALQQGSLLAKQKDSGRQALG